MSKLDERISEVQAEEGQLRVALTEAEAVASEQLREIAGAVALHEITDEEGRRRREQIVGDLTAAT